MKRNRTLLVFGITLLIAVAAGCNKDDDNNTNEPTLYTRLGGLEGISKVTDQFLANVAADSKINERFVATVADPYRLQLLRNNLIDQICAGSGGPCQYKGKTMLEAHTGMNISTDEFNALVNDLVASMTYYKVAEQEQSALLAILGPMQSDIVGK
ncbi:group I truncated hemoglobin [Chryseolinea lacunae]|uniref:Group 1 truncated hemoglobin n=1 Tax=Chryseolinea lacunae TaxID=2801331 RepID=A0ABS1KLE3_9BACT|nr:group 1 truncated hemoglobin [Chryseolinea lacunae]MBL0740283.1 group 1 truncated hemoglobin [Chryseolinea lacunae]